MQAHSPGSIGTETVSLEDFDWDNPVNLTQHSYWDFDPDYSPDGRQIAFHSNRPPSLKNRGQIYVMDADGSNTRARSALPDTPSIPAGTSAPSA